MKEAETLWIRHLEGAITPLLTVPLWGQTPPFPWEKVEKALKEALELETLHLATDKTHLLSRGEQLNGLGTDPLLLPLELTPLQGLAFWAMSKADMEKLSQLLLSPSELFEGFGSELLKEGYARFLLLKALRILNQENAFGEFTAQVGSHTELPEEALCLDLSIEIKKQKLWARLICSEALTNELHAYQPSHHLPLEGLRHTLRLPLAIEIGKSALSSGQLKKLKVKDLLLLDSCSFDPAEGKGTAYLTVAETPLFALRLKEGEVKILDYALYQEEPSMAHFEETPEKEREEGAEESGVETLISQRQIPLNVVVEAARLNLALDKVLHLKPGNLLDLKVGPQLTVSLTVGGALIAKGELVKIGETIGVRILALG